MANPIVQLLRRNRSTVDPQRSDGHQTRQATGLMTRFRSAYRAAIRDALEMPDSAAPDATDRAS